MTSPYLVGDLKLEEGLRLEAYPDPSSGAEPFTIGYGHTGPEVHLGLLWTEDQAATALASDIGQTCAQLDVLMPWWRTLNDARQDCFADMAFNLGAHGLLTFTTYLGFVKAGQYDAAADDLATTAWAREVGHRADRIAEQMRLGTHVPY